MVKKALHLLTAGKTLLLTAVLFAAAAGEVSAQTDPEYRAEVGAGAGLMAYQGDFNGSLTRQMQPWWAVVGKYRFNPYAALSLNICSGTLKGSSTNEKTWYPEINDAPVSFSTSVVDVGIRFEYNFWPYGTGREYRGAKRLTPYIVIGLGGTFAKPQGGSVFAMNLPIGIGMKYKVATRLNLSLEWVMHFSGSDKLDGVADPYGIKSSGLFKNTDCYSGLQVSLTYDIMAKCRTCHNDRE